MEFTVKIAGVNVGITSIFGEVFDHCKNFITDESPDFHVKTDLSDVVSERGISVREPAFEHRPYHGFPDPYLETLAVCRKIASGILRYDAFLMHGAVVGLHGAAYMFTAPSGVGKTTHARFWTERFPDAFIINGDKPVLRFADGAVYACGTPWAGKEGFGTNVMLPLKAVCLLTRGKDNAVRQVSFKDAYPHIIGQTYRPADAGELTETLRLIKKLGESTAFYALECNLDPRSADVAFEGMNR